jgi:hypothetical protein
MIHASSTENVADDDASYPLPTDIDVDASVPVGNDLEPVIVPVPQPPATTPGLPIPRARRELKTEIGAIKVAMAVLTKLAARERASADAIAVDALVCAATDQRYPLDDTDQIDKLRAQARRGEFTGHVPLAMDELEDALATLEAGLAALKAISLLDEAIPEAWGNLRSAPLARKLNVLGHTLLRGRIAGVNL